jgi:hypothetical protein
MRLNRLFFKGVALKLLSRHFSKEKKHLKLAVSLLRNEHGLTQLGNPNHSFPLPGIHIPAGSTCSSYRVALFAVHKKAPTCKRNATIVINATKKSNRGGHSAV